MSQTSLLGQVTIRWLDQNSTITSNSCRLLHVARAMVEGADETELDSSTKAEDALAPVSPVSALRSQTKVEKGIGGTASRVREALKRMADDRTSPLRSKTKGQATIYFLKGSGS